MTGHIYCRNSQNLLSRHLHESTRATNRLRKLESGTSVRSQPGYRTFTQATLHARGFEGSNHLRLETDGDPALMVGTRGFLTNTASRQAALDLRRIAYSTNRLSSWPAVPSVRMTIHFQGQVRNKYWDVHRHSVRQPDLHSFPTAGKLLTNGRQSPACPTHVSLPRPGRFSCRC